jgi:hypothetical protein
MFHHVEFTSKNKFEKLVHQVGFIIKKFVTMHGHMNVKFPNIISHLLIEVCPVLAEMTDTDGHGIPLCSFYPPRNRKHESNRQKTD